MEGLAIALLVGCWKECLLLQGERYQGFAGHLDRLALLRYRSHGACGYPDGRSHPGISSDTSYDCPEARSAQEALRASLAAAGAFHFEVTGVDRVGSAIDDDVGQYQLQVRGAGGASKPV